jgi:hypothetical protein
MKIVRLIAGWGYLGIADQKGQAAVGRYKAGCDWEDLIEAFYGAESDDVGWDGEAFRTAGEYIDVGQCKGADYFAEEGGLFLIGLD